MKFLQKKDKELAKAELELRQLKQRVIIITCISEAKYDHLYFDYVAIYRSNPARERLGIWRCSCYAVRL